jgi:serine/threonine-protein kinase
MTTTELGACEWFVWDLRRSNLIDRGQLDQLVQDFLKKHARAEPPGLAQFLVDQSILTSFQAERLLQGKSQGLVLGPYTVVDALGSGSMGTVYKALSKNDHQWYAVKVLPRRSMWNVRIARRQVRASEQVQHPAVVPFVDVGTAGGAHYLSWPLVEGETLEALVGRLGKLPPATAALYALQAAEGLDVCHRHNIVHGLIKPSNLMVGTDDQVRILDLGIGSILANSEGESLVDTMSTSNSLTSGLDCASPESIVEPSNRTPAGDQYSLGCVLYFCLTGRYPFTDCTAVEKMMWHQSKEPDPVRDLNPDVPAGLAAVVERLMKKAPQERYGSMIEAVEVLQVFAAQPSAKSPNLIRRPPAKGARTHQAQTPGSRVSAISAAPARSAPHRLPTEAPLSPVSTRDAMQNVSGPADAIPGPPVGPPRRPRIPVVLPSEGDTGLTLEDRFGPTGVFVGAMVAACLAWLLSLWIFK